MKKVEAFAMCSLFLGAGAITAQTPIPTDLDHFNCYLAPGPIQPAFALLHDQFDDRAPSAVFLPGYFESVTDLRPLSFCNPVQKTYNGATNQILHSDAHLLMYLINPQASIPRHVTVVNQFGTTELQTGRPVILAVPSGKALLTPAGALPALPPIPPEAELDHFKCYAAAGDTVDAVVSLTDQFLTGQQVEVLRPFLFCNPALKEVLNPNNPAGAGPTTTPINHPLSHLVCYLTTPLAFQGVVLYNNQFVLPGTVPTSTLSQSEILCVPSAKSSWGTIPAPTPGSAAPGS